MLAPRLGRVQHGIAETGAKVAERNADVQETLPGFALQSDAGQAETAQGKLDSPLARWRQIGEIGPGRHTRHGIMMGAVLPRFHQIGRHQRLGGGMRFPQFGRVGD
jgi:hypothetical protein